MNPDKPIDRKTLDELMRGLTRKKGTKPAKPMPRVSSNRAGYFTI
jgi:hypothetical protein